MEIQREILRLKDDSIQDTIPTGTGFVRDIGDDPMFTMKLEVRVGLIWDVDANAVSEVERHRPL
ncbi:MAG: hypothetical protein IH933_05280, partial [Euryarchaeota archaeon]|nr:hypothetical protein [Euryarchaeota archaeon]